MAPLVIQGSRVFVNDIDLARFFLANFLSMLVANAPVANAKCAKPTPPVPSDRNKSKHPVTSPKAKCEFFEMSAISPVPSARPTTKYENISTACVEKSNSPGPSAPPSAEHDDLSTACVEKSNSPVPSAPPSAEYDNLSTVCVEKSNSPGPSAPLSAEYDDLSTACVDKSNYSVGPSPHAKCERVEIADSLWCGSEERSGCVTDGLKNCLCCGLRCIPSDVPNTYCVECEDMMDEAQLGSCS